MHNYMFEDLKAKLNLTDFILRGLKAKEIQDLMIEYQSLDLEIQRVQQSGILASLGSKEEILKDLDIDSQATLKSVASKIAELEVKVKDLPELQAELDNLKQQEEEVKTKLVLAFLSKNPEILKASVDPEMSNRTRILEKEKSKLFTEILIKISQCLKFDLDLLSSSEMDDLIRAVYEEEKNNVPAFFFKSLQTRMNPQANTNSQDLQEFGKTFQVSTTTKL